jgi:hypothetical protein
MPLEPGSSKEVIGHNIKEMEQHGHPKKQAVAAALHNAYDIGDLNDNMLSFGAGEPQSNPTGPGDKPFTDVINNIAGVDNGEYGRLAGEYLGRNTNDVKFGLPNKAGDKDLIEWAKEEEKEPEHQ